MEEREDTSKGAFGRASAGSGPHTVDERALTMEFAMMCITRHFLVPLATKSGDD